MPETTNNIAMRPDIEVYMNMATKESPEWSRCGKGWKKFAENPNAQTESTQYINEASETTDTVSYSPQYSFECDLMHSEPTIKKVYDIAKDRKTGSEAVVDMLIVDKFDKSGSDGSYVARRESLAVAVSSLDGTKKMAMSGNLNGQGDGIKGKYTPGVGGASGTFTPDSAST